MSRRAPAAPDRSEQNRATLKQLVKLEANKSCADCKRNKHPRWASWNIGIFLCIRCSGIHRGMGTHISRVKSVDLDSWTDEQVQNMLRWGNARANKYWEHKLAEAHVPNEAKIENFIRTKYDSKRWVMDGSMPDPTTLDDGDAAADDDVPLNLVREKAMERTVGLKNGSVSGAAIMNPPRSQAQGVDLFGNPEEPTFSRSSTTEAASQKPTLPKAPTAPPKQTRPGESLLGLDFFGAPASGSARPVSSGPSTPGMSGRADLKSSILSLYASKPAAPPAAPAQAQQQAQSSLNAFSGMQTPSSTASAPIQKSSQPSFGGLNDAFSSLSFTSSPPQSQAQLSSFSGIGSSTGQIKQGASKSALSGGSFFDNKQPAQPAKPTSLPQQTLPVPRKQSFGADFGDFSSGALPVTSTKIPPANTSSMGDLFEISAPPAPTQSAATPAPAPKQAQQAGYSSSTAFNLSQPAPQPAATRQAPVSLSNVSSLSNADAWGSNDAWASADAPAQPVAPPIQTSTGSTFRAAAPAATQTPFDSGWGDVTSPTKSAGAVSVQQDEEFGGWSHASPVATNSAGRKQGSSSVGGSTSTSDDLFGNVWG